MILGKNIPSSINLDAMNATERFKHEYKLLLGAYFDPDNMSKGISEAEGRNEYWPNMTWDNMTAHLATNCHPVLVVGSDGYLIDPRETSYMTSKIVIFSIVYILIFLTALCGNFLVVATICRYDKMRTTTNIFVANLAVSDIVVCLTSLWITPVYAYTKNFIWGMPTCYILTLLQGSSIFVSTFTLTAIAIDRYRATVKPFDRRLDMKMCVGILVGIWITAVLLTIPFIFTMKYTVDKCDRRLCSEKWDSMYFRKIYSFVVMNGQFVIPIGIISYCYIKIYLTLRDQSKAMAAQRSVATQAADIQRKKRLNKMLATMVALFSLCWLPLNVTNTVHDFFGETKAGFEEYLPLIPMIAHSTAMSSTCWNPLLYAGMNEAFRTAFKSMLSCRRGEPRTHSQWV